MADLISREAALVAINEFYHDPKVDIVLRKLPAVDAVEVVYCDKCIYSNSCEIEALLLGDGIENPYCAGGERREET